MRMHWSLLAARQVFAISTEDMDALTFATPRLVRNLMAPATQKVSINEYDYTKVSWSLNSVAQHAWCTCPGLAPQRLMSTCSVCELSCCIPSQSRLSLIQARSSNDCLGCTCPVLSDPCACKLHHFRHTPPAEWNNWCAVQVLEGLGLTQDQFIDLCILCGCDYCGTIKGAGNSVLQRHGMPVAAAAD